MIKSPMYCHDDKKSYVCAVTMIKVVACSPRDICTIYNLQQCTYIHSKISYCLYEYTCSEWLVVRVGCAVAGGKLCCVVVDPGDMYQSLVTGPEMNRHLRVRPQAFLCTNRINSKQRKLFKLAGDKKWRTEFFMTKEKQWVNKSCTEICIPAKTT